MTIDPRTPVIVGVGQVTQRTGDPMTSLEPIDLLADAARSAVADAGGPGLAFDTVAVVEIMSWRYPDPAALLARRLGIAPRTSVVSSTGGNSPQMMVNRFADAIQRGDVDAVLLGGVECMYSRRRVRKIDPTLRLAWSQPDDPACPNVWGDTRPGSTQYEMAHRALAPTQVYPLLETAIRHAAGRSITDHQHHLGALWSELAAVAATNPYAWSPTAYTPDEIITPTADNRMACFPYTKRLCANLDVDQAAAIILCSYEAATAAGIAEDRMVFPWSGADAHDHYYLTERDSLAHSTAIGIISDAALDAAGTELDAIARFDLYSCFPSAVELALESIGLAGPTGGDERPISVTGGLAYGGGPGNNYVTHSIAAMVEACRRDPGSIGSVTALGWYATKHSVGLYSTTPPADGFRRVDPAITQARVDALPSRESAGIVDASGEVEATSVAFDRDGTPTIGIISVLLADGRRALANSADADTLLAMCAEPWEGRTVALRADGDTNVLA
ncbi:MAG: acetyl-CoA acetyltransferase [Acidimicrobiia bacterium]|nr:acetyl-CoA acetyltransferase [Acidimicrobiia bacterium]